MNAFGGVPLLNLGTAGIINISSVKRIRFRQSEIVLPGAREPGLNCELSFVDGEKQDLNHVESVGLYNYLALQGMWGDEIRKTVQHDIAVQQAAAAKMSPEEQAAAAHSFTKRYEPQ